MSAPVINLRDYRRDAADRGWGAGWPSCQAVKAAGSVVVSADRSGVRVSVHPRIARLVDLLLDETERRGFMLKRGQCGAYNCRPIGGTKVPSNHSWGLALDLNWQDNPFTYDLKARTIPDWMVAMWNRYGFAWGGHYSGKKDFMHFEFLGTPAQADAMTALAIVEIGGGQRAGAGVPTITAPQRRDEDVISPAIIQRDANGNFRGTAKVEAGAGSMYDAGWASLVATWGAARVAIFAQDGKGKILGRYPAQGYETVPNNREFIPGVPPGTRFVTFEGQADAGAVIVASGLCRTAA